MEKTCFATVRRGSWGAHSLLALAVTTVISSAAGPVQAEAASDSGAPTHEKRAQVAYALQDFPTAIREFEAAFQSEQKPDFLWGIAQAQRLSGDCKAAINTYKSYRRSEISAEQSATADSHIQHCEQELQEKAAQAAATPAPPLAHPPPLPTTPVAASAASAQTIAKAPHESPRPFYADAFGDVLVLTGVAAAGVGTYFLLAGNAAMRDARNSSYTSYDSDTRRASRDQLASAHWPAVGWLSRAASPKRLGQ